MLIETIWAAFEMEEILHELREHAAGLNAGRWDYIFSLIKAFRERPDMVLPDRGQVTMAVPVHARLHPGARARLPSPRRPRHRRHERVHPQPARAGGDRDALERVREDKEREAGDGFDGTWVAHPDLVPVAEEVFDRAPRRAAAPEGPAARGRCGDARRSCSTSTVPGGAHHRGRRAARTSASALQYLDNWLRGNGAAAINDLMEDVATAEISRSQLWQWRHHGSRTAEGDVVDVGLLHRLLAEEIEQLGGREQGRLDVAAELLYGLIMSDELADFLTLDAYRHLD